MSSDLLLSSLSKHFKEHKSEAFLLQQLVNGTYPISLRVIDWFVTHYSKMKNTMYWIDDSKKTMIEGLPSQFTPQIRKFHLYYEYRAQLKSYTKMYFDPFRRHDRISFVIQSSPLCAIETTLGQLNFFRWAIHNHILDYVQTHLVEIEEAMTSYQSTRKKRDGKEKEGKKTGIKDGIGNSKEKDTSDAKEVSNSKMKHNMKTEYKVHFD